MDAAEKLSADLASDEFLHGVRQGFWELVEREGWMVYVMMHAPDGASYLLALNCSSYGDEPIHGLFVDPVTRLCVASAWPKGNPTFEGWVKFKGPDHFICWHEDRGAIGHHQDWRAFKAWKKPNQIVSYLNFVRRLLHLESRGYSRRTPATG